MFAATGAGRRSARRASVSIQTVAGRASLRSFCQTCNRRQQPLQQQQQQPQQQQQQARQPAKGNFAKKRAPYQGFKERPVVSVNRPLTRPQGIAAANGDGYASTVIQAAAEDPRGCVLSNVIAIPVAPSLDQFTDMGDNVVPYGTKGSLQKLKFVPAKSIAAKDSAAEKAAEAAAAISPGDMLVFYGPQHVVHQWSMNFLEERRVPFTMGAAGSSGPGGGEPRPKKPIWPAHTMMEVTRQRYAHKDKTEPLWVYVLCRQGTKSPASKSPLVMSRVRRRLKRFLRRALMQEGYDSAGRPLEGFLPTKKPQQLYGTVKLVGSVEPMALLEEPVAMAYMTRVVKSLETVCAQRAKMAGQARKIAAKVKQSWVVEEDGGWGDVGAAARNAGEAGDDKTGAARERPSRPNPREKTLAAPERPNTHQIFNTEYNPLAAGTVSKPQKVRKPYRKY